MCMFCGEPNRVTNEFPLPSCAEPYFGKVYAGFISACCQQPVSEQVRRTSEMYKEVVARSKNCPIDLPTSNVYMTFVHTIAATKGRCRRTIEQLIRDVWDRFYQHCRHFYESRRAAWSKPEDIHYLHVLVDAFPDKKIDLLVELGDYYTSIRSWDKAGDCFKEVFASNGSVEVAIKLVEVYWLAGMRDQAAAVLAELCRKDPVAPTEVQLKQIDLLASKDLWLDALSKTQKGAVESSTPNPFYAKLADLYILLAQRESIAHLLQNFWGLAGSYVKHYVGQESKEQWNTQSIMVVLDLLDYICRRLPQSRELLQWFLNDIPYKNETVVCFFTMLQNWCDFVESTLERMQSQQETLYARLEERDIGDDVERQDLSSQLTLLRDAFVGGRYQDLPVGLIHYVGYYAQFLEACLEKSTTYPDQEQVALFISRLQDYTMKYHKLQDRVFCQFRTISAASNSRRSLKDLFEWRTSRYTSSHNDE